MDLLRNYFSELAERFGEGWNRFWYTPAEALSLGVLRIAVGLVALYTLATYGPDLEPLFGPGGLLPWDEVAQYRGATRNMERELTGGGASFTVFRWLTTPAEMRGFHYLSLAAAASFTLGLFSRATNVLTLIAALSYFHRGPMLTDALEPTLAMTLAYLCLAPSGASLSLDAWIRRRRGLPALETTIAGNLSLRLIQVHLTLIYTMMALGKLSGESWWTGTSLWWLAARVEAAPFDLLWLRHYPLTAELLTHLVLLFELSFAIFVWNRWTRPILLVVAPLPIGVIALFSGKFAFGAMLLAANLAFVPAAVYRALLRRRATQAA